MMKFYSLFLAAVLCATTAFAGELKIGSNGAKQNMAPIYVPDADRYQYHNQTIYEASELTDLAGQQITKITYYPKSTITGKVFKYVQISLMEVTATTFTDSYYLSTASAQIVYVGDFNPCQTAIELTFKEPYVYNGGNLLVDVQKTQPSGGDFHNTWGVQATYKSGSVLRGRGTVEGLPTSGDISYNRPDILFTYEPASASTCDKPANLAIDAKDAHSATFSWDEVEDANWQYICLPKSDEPNWDSTAVVSTQEHSATIENLKSDTEYKFHVRRYCAEDDQSTAASIAFKTDKSCFTPTSLYIPEELITDKTAKITWKTSGHGETQYQYTYDILTSFEQEPDWSKAVITDQLEVTLTGLTPESPYQIWVRSYCSEDDQSEAATEYFTTNEAAPTGISNTEVKANASKRIENGVLIIDNNGTLYNAQGTRLTK